MYTSRQFPLLIAAIALALGLLACDLPSFPMPTAAVPLPIATPIAAPPTVPATVVPAEAVPDNWPPAGATALYAAGSWENPRVYAVAADASTVDLGQDAHPGATVSRSGRWIAYPGGAPPVNSILIVDLGNGTTYTISTTSGFNVYGTAFDLAETRLAGLELGPREGEDTSWAIVVVNLEDGSAMRLDATVGSDYGLLPGIPMGWSASGNELLYSAFVPYSEQGTAGVWGIALPPGAALAPVGSLRRRELLPGGAYDSRPYLSPDGTRFLYLARDPDYTPAGYEPIGYDLAVNQLWVLDVASGLSTLLVEVTDGGALGGAVAWSPDGTQILFARGNYAGGTFASLALHARDGSGTIRDIGPLPLPPGGGLSDLDWCTPDVALVTLTTTDYVHELHTVDLVGGSTTLVTSDAYVSVLGCVR